ncbi:MAG: hypothetical protein ACXAC5_03390 [Promethearchaeota archaeon]|jgi:hypothetical protein
MNKTKYLEKHFGGKWKYDGVTSWWCDDGKRHVSRTASCMCDDICNHPPRYFLYGKDEVREIHDWFILRLSRRGER